MRGQSSIHTITVFTIVAAVNLQINQLKKLYDFKKWLYRKESSNHEGISSFGDRSLLTFL